FARHSLRTLANGRLRTLGESQDPAPHSPPFDADESRRLLSTMPHSVALVSSLAPVGRRAAGSRALYGRDGAVCGEPRQRPSSPVRLCALISPAAPGPGRWPPAETPPACASVGRPRPAGPCSAVVVLRAGARQDRAAPRPSPGRRTACPALAHGARPLRADAPSPSVRGTA